MHAALGTDGYELLSLDNDRKANRCTAVCLDARAELRKSILTALAEGHGTRRAGHAFGVSREVVRALKKQALASGELDQVKQALGRECFALAAATRDRIEDELDDMPRASLPIVLGVLVDKGQLLTGGPTSRPGRPDVEAPDINQLVASLPHAEVIELPVDSRENPSAKAAVSVEIVTPAAPTGDPESPVSAPGLERPAVDGAVDGQTDPKKDAA